MSSKAWARIGQASGIVGALSGVFGELGEATGIDAFRSIGSVAGSLSRVGVQVSTAGAFASADLGAVNNALVNAGPIVTALSTMRGQALPPPPPTSPMSTAVPPGGPVKVNIVDAVVDLLAAPLKLIFGLFKPRKG